MIAAIFMTAVSAASADTVHIAAAAKPWIELPNEAVISDHDDTGTRWKLSGQIPGSLTVARKDFEVCFNRQGWKQLNSTPTGMPGQRAELSTWTKGKRTLILMLSEDEPGRSSFYLGET